MNDKFQSMKPRDSLTTILSEYGRPFGGKSPGGGWKSLDAAALDGHVDYDHDSRVKPPTFIPLARDGDQNLFGLRVTDSVPAPSYWNRNRCTLTDVRDLVSIDRVFNSGSLVGFNDLIASRMRAVYTGIALDAQPVSGIRALFLEPLCIGDPDAAPIQYGRQAFEALRGADSRVAAYFGRDFKSVWDWRAWVATSRFLLAQAEANALALEAAVAAYENAAYAVIAGSRSLYWPAEAITVRHAVETALWPMLREMESRQSLTNLVTVSAGMLTAVLGYYDKVVARLLEEDRANYLRMPTIAEAYDLAMEDCLREEDPLKYVIIRRYGLPLRLNEKPR